MDLATVIMVRLLCICIYLINFDVGSCFLCYASNRRFPPSLCYISPRISIFLYNFLRFLCRPLWSLGLTFVSWYEQKNHTIHPFENCLFFVTYLHNVWQKVKVNLFYKKMLKVRLFEIKLRQKVVWDLQTVYKINKKIKKNLIIITS